ncbi:Peroxidasin [Dirofilaria immitis]
MNRMWWCSWCENNNEHRRADNDEYNILNDDIGTLISCNAPGCIQLVIEAWCLLKFEVKTDENTIAS